MRNSPDGPKLKWRLRANFCQQKRNIHLFLDIRVESERISPSNAMQWHQSSVSRLNLETLGNLFNLLNNSSVGVVMSRLQVSAEYVG